MSSASTPRDALTTADGLDGLVEIAVGLLTMSMFVLLAVQIFFRYMLNNSIMWAEEVLQYLFAWMIFLGAAVNVRRRGHILIDVLIRQLPRRAQRVVEGLLHALLVLVFTVMTWKGAEFAYQSWDTQAMSLDIPLTCVYGAVPVGFALMTRSQLQLIWRRYVRREGQD